MSVSKSYSWIGLMIGNSRLHWAKFEGNTLQQTWDSQHSKIDFSLIENLPLYIASVVSSQTKVWENYPKVKIINLEDVPINGLYPTLGIDRALAILGASNSYKFPCLVIDAGTALTFTGVDNNYTLIGGAILPGLGLQLQTLATKTAGLPHVKLPEVLPPRWAKSTPEAIKSGVIYTILAGVKDFIEDWGTQFPQSEILLTGGDGQLLWNYLHNQFPNIAQKVKVDPYLIFWGMRELLPR